ncbi:MAG: hypothetical protein HY984_01430 [Candidatus Magasanikbacteria bacterium]|nr:hypothetical protein [Candidatus Magasanikbacteria bacterium]
MLLLPTVVGAINLGSGLASGAAKEAGYSLQTTETTFSETLGTVIKAVLSFVGVIFLILMVYAGFLWMTAQGKEDQVEKATGIIRTSIIGLIIATGAYTITAFVIPRILSRTAGGSASGSVALICCKLESTTEVTNIMVSSQTDCTSRCDGGTTLRSCMPRQVASVAECQ